MIENSGPFYTMSAVDSNHAWVMAQNGLFRTQDGGATWTNLEKPPGGLSGPPIQFVDASHGWAISGRTVSSTSDGGESWTDRLTLLPSSPSLWSSMSFISDTTGWVATYLGDEFSRTTDGGATWTALELPPGSDPTLKFIDAQHGWLTMYTPNSGGGRLYTTADAGATWQQKLQIETGSFIRAIDAVSPSVAWATVAHAYGVPCDVYRTTDSGTTWSASAVEGTESQDLRAFDFVNSVFGWTATNKTAIVSEMFHSSDGGATWSVVDLPETPDGPWPVRRIYGLVMVNSTTGWAGGSVGTSYSPQTGSISQETAYVLRYSTGN